MKQLPDNKQELLDRLSKLTPSSPRQFGKMTPNQAVCHLSDAFRLPLKEVPSPVVGNIFQRTVGKYVALHLMTNWPPGVKTRPEFDQDADGTKPATFEADKAELQRLLDRFTALPESYIFPPHPLFGELTRWEWMRWGYQHVHHHLRQFGV